MGKIVISKHKGFRIPIWPLRIASVILIGYVILSGAACKSGYGRLCIFEKSIFGITCPLGFLGAAFASKSLLPILWPSVGVVILLIILFGRFFCAWICPASIVYTLKYRIHFNGFRKRKSAQNTLNLPNVHLVKKTNHSFLMSRPVGKSSSYSGLAILVGALTSSYLFGFPVFCLICPVGLTFGAIFAVMRLLNGMQLGLELVVFPIMIILELFVLKSWCRSLCPLGTLHGLIGRLNFFFRPKVQNEVCLVSQGINCRACEKVCSQNVNLGKHTENFNSVNCTKCMECYEKCPVRAIQIKLF